MTSHRCTTVQQGYDSHTAGTCLPHTGTDLSLLAVGAFAILAAGLLLREVVRPQKRRRKNWTREYRAASGDWEAGYRPFHADGIGDKGRDA